MSYINNTRLYHPHTIACVNLFSAQVCVVKHFTCVASDIILCRKFYILIVFLLCKIKTFRFTSNTIFVLEYICVKFGYTFCINPYFTKFSGQVVEHLLSCQLACHKLSFLLCLSQTIFNFYYCQAEHILRTVNMIKYSNL